MTPHLLSDLADYGVTVESTSARLAEFKTVANTYLSTFQALGSLGLLLGTVGMVVVLLRNLLERQGELALLAAVGFSPRRRAFLVILENATLLTLGLTLGTASALLAILPAARAINLLTLSSTLAAILLFGLAVSTFTTFFYLRSLTPAALRRE